MATVVPKVPPLSKLLTFGEVATLLGYEGDRAARRVRRWLLAQDWRDEVLVLWTGRPGSGRRERPRYRVSLTGLRTHVPALRPRREEAVELVREAVEGLEEGLDEARDDLRTVAREAGRHTKTTTEALEARLLGRLRRLEAAVTELRALLAKG